MKTNQMHYLFFIYFVTQFLHVLGVFIVHHQEIFTVYAQQLVHVIRLSWLTAGRVRKSLYIYGEYLLLMGNKHAQNMYRLTDKIN
jgi:hypothetical protein